MNVINWNWTRINLFIKPNKLFSDLNKNAIQFYASFGIIRPKTPEAENDITLYPFCRRYHICILLVSEHEVVAFATMTNQN
jgi:hypothetical protein